MDKVGQVMACAGPLPYPVGYRICVATWITKDMAEIEN